MKKLLKLSWVILLLAGCKTQNINFTVPEKTLPARFQQYEDSTSIVDIKWRDYFGDSQLEALIDTALASNIDLNIALERI